MPLYANLNESNGSKKMTLITTRPFSPVTDQKFTGNFCYINNSGDRAFVQVEEGVPSVEPVDLQPGRYSIEWVEAGKEPQFDVAMIPADKPEVELSDVLYSLKKKPVEEEAVKAAFGEPQLATETGETPVTDPTVSMQPPATEQEVAGANVTTKRITDAPEKRKGAADA